MENVEIGAASRDLRCQTFSYRWRSRPGLSNVIGPPMPNLSNASGLCLGQYQAKVTEQESALESEEATCHVLPGGLSLTSVILSGDR